MTKVVDIPNRSSIRDEASRWVAKLDAGNMTPDDLRELRSWVEQGPVHTEEMERMVEIWDSLDILASYKNIIIEPQKSVFHRFWIPVSIAACLAILSSSLLFFTGYFPGERAPETAQNYETGIGEQKTVRLSDGSSLKMNTASKLNVDYKQTQRTVYLKEGEAFFEVEADSQRPFVVETAQGRVTAVGTAFSVRSDKNGTQVTVSEGVVKLSSKNEEETASSIISTPQIKDLATVIAGQSASFDKAHASIETLEPKKIIQSLAWRDGMLVFEGDTLESVINEVSRYTPVQILISDPELKQLRIGGYFRVGEIDSLLKALEKGFGVRVEQASTSRIVLHSDSG